MSKMIFIDSGCFIALANADDRFHDGAKKVFDDILQLGYKPVTTDYVYDELFTWMRCKQKMRVSDVVKFGASFRMSQIKMYGITDEIFYDAFDKMLKYDDQYFSFTDCVSFVLMSDLKITDVVTTDRHFVVAGFNNLLKI